MPNLNPFLFQIPLLALAAAACLATPACAQLAPAPAPAPDPAQSAPAVTRAPPIPPQISPDLKAASQDVFLQTSTYRLWPNRAPLSTADADIDTPTLTVFTPQRGHHTGAAVLIAPGGGYIGLAANIEGRQVADWFAARGVTAFVLKYRLNPKYDLPASMLDGDRAMRFIRANASGFGIDADRIGMIGFSAGGHLAAMTAIDAAGSPSAADPIDRLSARPDFLVLGYPWLHATRLLPDGTSPYCSAATYVGGVCKPADYAAFAPIGAITAAAPPTFIYHTTNDETVPVEAAIDAYAALQRAGVDSELHIFARGLHGSGLGRADPALSQWPDLLDAWLRARGYLAKT